MEVKSTGTSEAIVNLTDWRDIYAYARLVKENKPFETRVKSMEINGTLLTVECILGRTEVGAEKKDSISEHLELPNMEGEGIEKTEA